MKRQVSSANMASIIRCCISVNLCHNPCDAGPDLSFKENGPLVLSEIDEWESNGAWCGIRSRLPIDLCLYIPYHDMQLNAFHFLKKIKF